MPRGDRTGPLGMGPRTGRAAGFCADFGMAGYANPVPGRGLGMGYGRVRGAWSRGFGGGGRGWRNMFYATGLPGWARLGGYAAPFGYPMPQPNQDPELEKQALNNQAQFLQSELEEINKRLSELEKNIPEK